jgi:DNA-binding transcriptional ArsR family regulator
MTSVKARSSIESTLAGIVAHPTRVKCLSILAERRASPNEIAIELGEEVGNVSYHVKKLVTLGAVELVDKRQVRGAIEHFYRAVTLVYVSDEEWAKLSVKERRPTSLYGLQLAMTDAAVAMEAGTFDARADRYLTRTPAVVDEEGWSELNRLHAEMLERTMDIKAASAGRLAKAPGKPGIPVMQIAMFFEQPQRKAPSDLPPPSDSAGS